MGDSGDDVYELQLFLMEQDKGEAALTLKEHGATHFFGPLTRAALAEYQAQSGISPSVGYFGVKTRGMVNGR